MTSVRTGHRPASFRVESQSSDGMANGDILRKTQNIELLRYNYDTLFHTEL